MFYGWDSFELSRIRQLLDWLKLLDNCSGNFHQRVTHLVFYLFRSPSSFAPPHCYRNQLSIIRLTLRRLRSRLHAHLSSFSPGHAAPPHSARFPFEILGILWLTAGQLSAIRVLLPWPLSMERLPPANHLLRNYLATSSCSSRRSWSARCSIALGTCVPTDLGTCFTRVRARIS